MQVFLREKILGIWFLSPNGCCFLAIGGGTEGLFALWGVHQEDSQSHQENTRFVFIVFINFSCGFKFNNLQKNE